jgi:hypothetical protein
MKYNAKHKVLFKFNPSAQAVLGQWFGWYLVFEAYTDASEYHENDEVEFTYTGRNWNALVDYLKEDVKC